MQSLDDRPPAIQFERRQVEDRAASQAQGHYVPKDVDIVILQRPGSRDTVEKEVSQWLKEWDEKARQNLLPLSWALDAKKGYEYWKSGEELPPNGTPIKGWPVLSPAQQRVCIEANIRTVEDLGALPDGSLGVLGIGGLGMKMKARAWLMEAETKGIVAEQNAKLQLQVEEQKRQIEELSAGLAAMKLLLPQAQAQPGMVKK